LNRMREMQREAIADCSRHHAEVESELDNLDPAGEAATDLRSAVTRLGRSLERFQLQPQPEPVRSETPEAVTADRK